MFEKESRPKQGDILGPLAARRWNLVARGQQAQSCYCSRQASPLKNFVAGVNSTPTGFAPPVRTRAWTGFQTFRLRAKGFAPPRFLFLPLFLGGCIFLVLFFLFFFLYLFFLPYFLFLPPKYYYSVSFSPASTFARGLESCVAAEAAGSHPGPECCWGEGGA